MKTFLSRFFIRPVFEENVVSLDTNLAGYVFLSDRIMVFIEELRLNTGKRLANMSSPALAVVGIRNAHADLGHAVAF